MKYLNYIYNLDIWVYIVLLVVLFFLLVTHKTRKIRLLYLKNKAYSPNRFFECRRKMMKDKVGDIEGIYVFHNKSKRKYYVGQSKKLYSRVNNHLTGKGNGDVYADYIYGDRIRIKLISKKGSGYHNLNKMEKDFIKYFNAYSNGYNKTIGNK